MLDGVNVALGVTGSIAAVRGVELVHELRRRGASVRVVMTEAATGIVHPWSLEFASERPVVTELTGRIEHVELCGPDGWADVLAIAPATANTVGKIAHAIDDTTVTTCATTAIGSTLPLVIAPAMHEPMYDHDGVIENLEVCRERYGAVVAPPRIEEGKAKIAEDDTIALAIARAVGGRPLADHRIVVTSGATTEPIDPVRVLTTRASGKTGRALARASYAAGAEVTLVHDGPRSYPFAEVIQAETAEAFETAAVEATASADAFLAAAAVSDFSPEYRSEKIRSGSPLTLELHPTGKVIEAVRGARPDLPIVGFKAESGLTDDDLVEQARSLLDRGDLTFVVANDADVMAADETRVLIVTRDDVEEVTGRKLTVAMVVIDRLVEALGDTRTK
ncbi:MAG: bifunctional phosphopantothenoylcysteine decarboxylase/phosphopantothenate--cysteine ligase CoaBC [Halobacteriota archaeon]